MRKFRTTIFITLILLIGATWLLTPHVTHAQATAIAETVSTRLFASILANLSHAILALCSWFVTIGGTFLNWSIYITTHLQNLYNQEGLRAVWITIRDLSSLFIIFMLLYSAIKMIIGADGAGFGKLVGKIFIAGLLINFSLFFVRVGIDLSNIVSLQFYEAIAPQQMNSSVDSAYLDGGLSNIFMNSLKLPKIYNDTSWTQNRDIDLSIFLATTGGAIMMITAGLSFMAAAIAFVVRTGILLFAMAISPLLFLSVLFPGIPLGNVRKMVQGQLTFMPVYLGLMYIALRIISDPAFLNLFRNTATPEQTFGATSIGVVIQYTIAIVFINFPLVTAISMSGTKGYGMKWAPTAGAVAGTISGLMGRHTAGRLVDKVIKPGERFDNFAANATKNSKLGQMLFTTGAAKALRSGIGKVEEAKYGGALSFKTAEKEGKARLKELAGVRRDNQVSDDIDAVVGKNAPTPTPEIKDQFRKTVSKMNKKEIEDIKFEKLKNTELLTKFSSKQFDTLIDGDTLLPDQKEELKKIRKESLKNELLKDAKSSSPEEKKAFKERMKNLSGKELAGLDKSIWDSEDIRGALRIPHLTEMKDLLDTPERRKIGDWIDAVAPPDHHAAGWITKPENKKDWVT